MSTATFLMLIAIEGPAGDGLISFSLNATADTFADPVVAATSM
jgi:hypothetical protein